MRRTALFLLLAWQIAAAGLAPVAMAQGEAIEVRVSEPLLESFPRVRLRVQVSDATGRRLPNLPSSSFILFENEDLAFDLSLREVTVGTRLVFAINTNLGLRIRDALGRSRYDLARQALLEWWSQPQFTTLGAHDFSLITPDDLLLSHTPSSADLAASLDHHQPRFEDADTAYELAFQAFDLLTEPAPQPGMRSFLILLTALPRPPRGMPLENIISRARSTGTSIYPVLLANPEDLELPETEPLKRLAEETGGRLVLLDPEAGLADLADLIADQGRQYELTYTSRVTNPGPHQIRLEVNVDGVEVAAPVRSFSVDLRPPEILLLDPPRAIRRASDDPTLPLAELPPKSVEVEFLANFPDGYARPLALSQLRVDGQVVSEQEQPPFEVLTWDLGEVVETGEHRLQVRVVDSIGMEALSSVAIVRVEVQAPPQGLAAIRPGLLYFLAAIAILLAGAGLAVGLLSMGQRAARPGGTPRETSTTRAPRAATLHRELPDEPAEAHLRPVSPSLQLEDIPLIGKDVILGRDPSLAAVPLDHPSVDRMHARLIRLADGGYLLQDQGSLAGTWVNFEQIPESGVRLRHGDQIHLGDVCLRFEYENPPEPRRIVVKILEDDKGLPAKT